MRLDVHTEVYETASIQDARHPSADGRGTVTAAGARGPGGAHRRHSRTTVQCCTSGLGTGGSMVSEREFAAYVEGGLDLK